MIFSLIKLSNDHIFRNSSTLLRYPAKLNSHTITYFNKSLFLSCNPMFSPKTQEIRVIKNQQGKLGFHIQFQGIVGDVTENGPAWAAGLRCSSRLVEVSSQCLVSFYNYKMCIYECYVKYMISGLNKIVTDLQRK